MAWLAVIACLAVAGDAHAASRPNIVLVLTDDQTIESFDSKYMPKLNAQIARRGMVFSRYYNTFPMCCPSRTSLFRGQYAHNTGVINNGPPNGGFWRFMEKGLNREHVGVWLSRAGYRTGIFGKFLNGYGIEDNRVVEGFHTWFVRNSSGQPYYDYSINSNGESLFFGSGERNYLTNVLARRSLSFMRGAVRDGKPFFAIFAPYSPHAPSTPEKLHLGRFADEPFPRKPNFNETSVSDKPGYVRVLPPIADREIDNITRNWRSRLEANLSVDDFIGRLFTTLRELDAEQNTYVFVTTDNGFQRGEHRIAAGKAVPYDESLRSKLFVFGPGVRAGVSSDALVANIDLAPTFAALAQAGVPDFIDGRSLAPLFAADVDWRKALTAMGYPPVTLEGEAKSLPSAVFRSLITRDYIFTVYPDTAEREAYDFRIDPFELNNIAQELGVQFRVDAEDLLASLQNCAGEQCRETDTRLPPALPDAD